MTKVLYDYQGFMEHHGGVSNSFVQLISHLPESIKYDIGIVDSDNEHLKHSNIADVQPCRLLRRNFIKKEHFPTKGHLYDMYKWLFPYKTSEATNEKRVIELLQREKYDVFHPTYFHPYFLKYIKDTPFVLTIHDMTPERAKQHDKQKKWKRLLAPKAAHIIAVSESTKNDVVEMLGISPSKISVIYHAAPDNQTSVEPPIFSDFPYILFVGRRGGYKNFGPMVRSMAPILRNHPQLHLVCTGNPFTAEEETFLKELGISDQTIQYYAADTELQNLYANACCFIFPSEYEGFGIPILEAYNAHCPVLLNNASCFPEIAQDAALFFNMNSEGTNLAEVLEDFLSWDNSKRRELITRQDERLKFFSWEKSARQLSEIYEKVAQHG